MYRKFKKLPLHKSISHNCVCMGISTTYGCETVKEAKEHFLNYHAKPFVIEATKRSKQQNFLICDFCGKDYRSKREIAKHGFEKHFTENIYPR